LHLKRIFFSQEDEEEKEEHDRPVTPSAQMQATGLFSNDAPPSSKLELFAIAERKEVLSVVSWNTHSFRFLNKPEQRMGMARVLSRYDLVLLQEIPCGEQARESLEYFCSVMNPGGDNPFDFLLSETLTASSSSLNAILFRRAEWHVVHTTSLSHHLHPPVAALLKRKRDDLKDLSRQSTSRPRLSQRLQQHHQRRTGLLLHRHASERRRRPCTPGSTRT